MLKGTITLTRALLDHMIWEQDLSARAAAIDILLRANNRPGVVTLNGQRMDVKRGQLAWSKEKLAGAWNCSVEKLEGILRFLQFKAEFIKVEKCGPRGTIITVINYDRYNPEPNTGSGAEPGADLGADADAGLSAGSGAEPGRNKEIGREIGNRKGEGNPPFAEIPSDVEVGAFCAAYQDLARGVTGIPEVWWRGWYSSRISARSFPVHWKDALTNAFLSDFLIRHPKALVGLNEKNGEKIAATTPAQRRFLLERDLRAVRERLDAAHQVGVPPDQEDVRREMDLDDELEKMVV